MVTVQKIISYAQTDLNDLSGDRIHEAEYIDLLNDISAIVAQETEVWIGRYKTIPNTISTVWGIGINYAVGEIIFYQNNYYYCIIAHTSSSIMNPTDITRWTIIPIWDATTNYIQGQIIRSDILVIFYRALINNTGKALNDSIIWEQVLSNNTIVRVVIPYTDTFGNVIAPYKFLNIHRGNSNIGYFAVKEFSIQAIIKQQSTPTGFDINDITLYDSAATTFINSNLLMPAIDNSITLHFSTAFEVGEELIVDFIQGRPFLLNNWVQNPTISVPDFLDEVLKYGLKWKVFERCFNKGDDTLIKRVEMAYNNYNKELSRAISYSKNFKDKKSSLLIQPLKYLREY